MPGLSGYLAKIFAQSAVLLTALLATLPQATHAQTLPYVWGAPITPNSAGCIDYMCDSPMSTCANRAAYYPGGTILSLVRGYSNVTLKPTWICTHSAINPPQIFTAFIGTLCPAGYVSNYNAKSGCATKPLANRLGKPNCSTQGNVQRGNPITICSGNKFEEKIDYTGGGQNKLSFIRYYNSLGEQPGALGTGWKHNFEARLQTGLWSIYAIHPDGLQFEFDKSSLAPSEQGVMWRLTAAPAGASYAYALADENNTVEKFDINGRLLEIEKINGYKQTMEYTGANLTRVYDSLGRQLLFAYDTAGFLTKVTDPENRDYKYEYTNPFPTYTNSNVRVLTKVTYPDSTAPTTDNPFITYHYGNADFPIALTGITDELGNLYASWTYDSLGRAKTSTHAGGADAIDIIYHADTWTNSSRTVTGPLGDEILYTFDAPNNPRLTREDRAASGTIPAAYRTYTYTRGFLTSMRDWKGNVTNYVNNTRGLQTSRTEAFGTAQARTITTAWHATFNLPTQIVETGKTTDFTYDTTGNLLTKTQTDTQTQTIPYSTNGATRTWTYTYDSLGNVLTANGPRTDVTDTTTYTYHPTNKNLATVTDAVGNVTTFTSYNNSGLPLSYTDENGTVINLTYDALNRIKTRTIVSTAGNATTTFTYNAAGLITEIEQPSGNAMTYGYDHAHRVTSVTNDAGEKLEYTYDAANNITEEKYKTSSGTLRAQQNYTFDVLGRMIKSMGIASTQGTEYGYDANGNRISIKSPTGYTTNQAFDALNRLITVTDPLTKVATTTYDKRDNITAQTDFRTLSTSYVYNGFNQLIQATSPESGTTVYTLDKAGNRISETDARSIVTNRTFDALNRVTAVTYPSNTAENITFAYDSTAGGNKGKGKLTGMTNAGGSTAWVYDDRGNITQKTTIISGKTYVVAYAYDLADRLTKVTYPDGRVAEYSYGTNNQVQTIVTRPTAVGTATNIATSVAYEPFGPLKSMLLGNGLTHTRGYNQNYWPTSIQSANGGTVRQNLSLTFDNGGNVLTLNDAVTPTQNQTFTYNALDQVATASGVYGSITYTYDDNGNRKTRVTGGVTQTYNYPITSNKLSTITIPSSTTQNFSYALNGTMTGDDRAASPDVTYGYSVRNRMNQVITGGTTTSYLYDGIGQRISKSNGTTTTHFIYDEDGKLLAEANGTTGAQARAYLYLNTLPVAQVESGGTIYYALNDQIGTVQKLTNASNAVAWSTVEQPFGETISSTGSPDSKLRFPGQYADAESGLRYNYFRDYNPALGRYLQPDPIGQIGGLNLYGYAGQNPVRFTDPNGLVLQFCIPFIAPEAIAITGMALTAAGFAAHQAGDSLRDWYDTIRFNEETPEPTPADKAKEEASGKRRPPTDLPNIDDLNDPTKPNPEGWKWKGRGEPGSRDGAWTHPEHGNIHDDRTHPPGKPPHVQWIDPNDSTNTATDWLDGNGYIPD